MSEVIPFKRRESSQDLALQFLSSPGHKRDAEYYLNHFLSYSPESFAIIVLEESVLREDLDGVLFEIRYLMRLGLYPVVLIHSTDTFLEKLEIESYFKRARMALNFMAQDTDDDEKLEFVKRHISKSMLPLVQVDTDKNIFKEVWKFSHILKTHKVFFLRKEGGFFNQENHELISMINLNAQNDLLNTLLALNEPDTKFLKSCESLIRKAPQFLTISLVSPNNLLHELLTVKGAGTLILAGTQIITHKDWTTVDRLRLAHLIQTQTQKQLGDSFFSQGIECCYIEEEYRGAAVLQKRQGMTYLRYFCVGVEARGVGTGKDLWNEINQHQPKIFWKSRTSDFITRWYVKQCDGMHSVGDWTVFWKGIKPEEIGSAILTALKEEETTGRSN